MLYEVITKPVYIEMDGWEEDIQDVKEYDKLPENAKKYIEKIEELVKVPVDIVSVGPDREQTMIRREIV